MNGPALGLRPTYGIEIKGMRRSDLRMFGCLYFGLKFGSGSWNELWRSEEGGGPLIEQVLNKRFLQSVLRSMETVAMEPQDDDDRRGETALPEPLNAHENELLLTGIRAAKSYRTVPAEEDSDRRGGEPELSVQDRKAFMPGTPELANLQSAIDEYCTEMRPDLLEETPTRSDEDDDDRRREPPGLTQSRLKGLSEDVEDRRLFGPFEQTDLRWINSKFAQGLRKFRGKHDFVSRPARPPVAFADANVRMVIFGDWASGIPRALKVGKAIRRELDEGKKLGKQQHVIHLGDVYYSGWESEYRDRLLKDWPVRLDEKGSISSFNLNGNHDMFSGGWAYYDYALKDERFKCWQGKSSLFQLENSKWQIFGMDTAWENAALKEDQAAWILGAAKPGKKTILLSHHQFCSSYEGVSADVTERIAPVLQKLDVVAWLWGHEHRCETYNAVPGIRFPRCLGHGGVPVYQFHDRGDPLPAPGQWEYRDYVDGNAELWSKFGFVTLDFEGDTVHVRYLNEDGGVDRTETMT